MNLPLKNPFLIHIVRKTPILDCRNRSLSLSEETDSNRWMMVLQTSAAILHTSCSGAGTHTAHGQPSAADDHQSINHQIPMDRYKHAAWVKKTEKNFATTEIFSIFVAPKKGRRWNFTLLSKKELWLTLSVVCLAGLKDYGNCLNNIGSLVWDWGVLLPTKRFSIK